MRVPWKVVGLAGLAGVAATGVVLARKRRSQQDPTAPGVDEGRAQRLRLRRILRHRAPST